MWDFLGILGDFWGIFKNLKNRKKNICQKVEKLFFRSLFFISEKYKKIAKSAFFCTFWGIFKNPRNLKIPPEWQPWWVATQNIAYVSAFMDPYPHMKFQVDILSGSKVTEGDGPTDRRTDRRTDRPTLWFI